MAAVLPWLTERHARSGPPLTRLKGSTAHPAAAAALLAAVDPCGQSMCSDVGRSRGAWLPSRPESTRPLGLAQAEASFPHQRVRVDDGAEQYPLCLRYARGELHRLLEGRDQFWACSVLLGTPLGQDIGPVVAMEHPGSDSAIGRLLLV